MIMDNEEQICFEIKKKINENLEKKMDKIEINKII